MPVARPHWPGARYRTNPRFTDAAQLRQYGADDGVVPDTEQAGSVPALGTAVVRSVPMDRTGGTEEHEGLRGNQGFPVEIFI